jgi:hypothetical protein
VVDLTHEPDESDKMDDDSDEAPIGNKLRRAANDTQANEFFTCTLPMSCYCMLVNKLTNYQAEHHLPIFVVSGLILPGIVQGL